MAVQPLHHTYDFWGYQAPIIQFLQPGVFSADTRELAPPALYSVIDFTQSNGLQIQWSGTFTMEQPGTLSALRFVTKNILAILLETSSTIDWLNHYMSLPVPEPFEVKVGDVIEVSFSYRAGGSFASLQNSLQVHLQSSAASRAGHLRLVHA